MWTSVTGTNIVMRANQSKLNKSKNRAVVTFGKRSSMGTTTPRLTRPAIRVVIIHLQFNGCKNLTIAKLTIFNGLNRRGLHFHCLHPFRSNGCLGNPSLQQPATPQKFVVLDYSNPKHAFAIVHAHFLNFIIMLRMRRTLYKLESR